MRGSLPAFLAAVALVGVGAAPPSVRPSLADSFRLGQGGDTLCRVQSAGQDAAAIGLYDRAYAIVCRDAAAPVGRLYVLRRVGSDPAARLTARRDPALKCQDASPEQLADVGTVAVRHCTGPDGLRHDELTAPRGRTYFAAEGLAGYRSALELGLRTIVADRIVPGEIKIALTELGDPTSFARAQAGSLDPQHALVEGYRRNNGGNYAEASEFFDTLLHRTLETGPGAPPSASSIGEYLVNNALQQSDLGDTERADALFAQVALIPTRDPVELRLRRNYRALHFVNQGLRDEALAVLDEPVDPEDAKGAAAAEHGSIDVDTAIAMNEGGPFARQLGLSFSATLTPAEKRAILDAQALAIRGGILRARRDPRAGELYKQALASVDLIRAGRVASVARLRGQIMTDQAALAEEAGDAKAAEALLKQAIAVVAVEYPGSIVLHASEARLAGFYARRHREDEALALYRSVAAALGSGGGAPGSVAALLEPYFRLLVARAPADPALYGDMFLASQALLRPGVADTQATLARELSAGSGEAARIFRASLNQARQASALRIELARLSALDRPTPEDKAGIATDRDQIAEIEAEQSATQDRLNQFPAYRAISTQALTLADLRKALRPGEAYWKLTVAGSSIFGLLVASDAAQAWRVPLTPDALAAAVDAIRASIVIVRDGKAVTSPFDLAAARRLYVDLAGPAAGAIAATHHLIFEPDGAMQRLPITLMVASQPGVDNYYARQSRPRADPFDLTGVDWLGGRVDVSVALSARAFRDLRGSPASTAPRQYLGFGHNAPVSPFLQLTGYPPPAGAIDCRLPLKAWSNPISAAELGAAEGVIGANRSQVVTGAAFSDSDIVHRDDLARYRILHFATHGIVTAPRPECPAVPALMTSFGGKGSDGLLSFGEIYGLNLDADLILLSACDTAGTADVATTRAAGVLSGGGNALDGLVRAFIGSGGRALLASHWPAPDDYKATERLVGGLFTAPPGTSTADALRQAELKLMAAPETSHPYYWAGFALIGDGARPVLRPN